MKQCSRAPHRWRRASSSSASVAIPEGTLHDWWADLVVTAFRGAILVDGDPSRIPASTAPTPSATNADRSRRTPSGRGSGGAAEALCCISVRPGDVLVQDRGYARVRDFAHAHANGADFIIWIGWRSVRLLKPSGGSLDPLAALPEGQTATVEHTVRAVAWRRLTEPPRKRAVSSPRR